MPDDIDAPIALRRTRRSTAELSRLAGISADVATSCISATVKTPGKRGRPKKRVRFSDPGPSVEQPTGPTSTGLTPMVQRTSLSSERRRSTPARASGLGPDSSSQPFTGEMTFLPLRQVLDGRVKRRIRRNGLSEEMNTIYSEKKRRSVETKAELERLKAEVAEKDAEILRLQEEPQDDTVMQDTGRMNELERQVDELRRQLASRSGVEATTPSEDRTYDWTAAAKDPFADYSETDPASETIGRDNEDEFGEVTMADLICSTPTRASRNMGSFPTPPSTSPAVMPLSPMTPTSHFSTPRSHAGVQVAMPDPEKQDLEDELASLQLEICKLTSTLGSHETLTRQLSEQLASFTAAAPSSPGAADRAEAPHSDLESRLAQLLQTLSDRTACLLDLSSSLSDLGFPGSDASEIITSLSSAFRAARLELEYLTPGEISLPLNSVGAQVLDLLLDRLRDLARKSKEADAQID